MSQGLMDLEAHMRVARMESVAKTCPLWRSSRMSGSSVVVSAHVLKLRSAADFFIGRSLFGVIRSHCTEGEHAEINHRENLQGPL